MRYDYYCPKCNGIKEDVIHGCNESPEIICEKCKTKMKIKIGVISFIKGKTWDGGAGLNSDMQDILRHQASVIGEAQGGL